ncbi:hypothetical protein Ahia01_000608200 [Argonauta hians]
MNHSRLTMDQEELLYEPVNTNNSIFPRTYCVTVGVPLRYVGKAVTALLEIITYVRSKVDPYIEAEYIEYRKPRRKVLRPTTFTYDAIADECLSSYFAWYGEEFKDNFAADGIINEDKIFLNFYLNDNSRTVSIYTWETWKIKVSVNPTKTMREVVTDLENLTSVISESIIEPLPRAISLFQYKHIFRCCRRPVIVNRNFIKTGSNSNCKHILQVNTNFEKMSKILSIIFESILFHRCMAKLTPREDGKYKTETRLFTTETVSEFRISYSRICCDDLNELLRSRVNYCFTRAQNEHTAKKIKIFYLSFYRLKETKTLNTTRKLCERWQIVCHLEPDDDMPLPSNLPEVLSYIEQTNFPDSLRIYPQILDYDKLHRYYFTTMTSCTPPRFYIHF